MTAGTGWWKGPARRLRDSAVWNPPLTSAAKSVLMASRQPPPDWLVARVPRIGYARATLPNGTEMVMHAREHDHISTGVFWRGWTAWEPELLPIWFGAASRAVNVIDVGAHVGQHTITAALANPHAHVHAYEPLPRVNAYLRANIKLNQLPNVSVSNRALGRTSGRASLHSVNWGLPSSSSLSDQFVTEGAQATEETAIQVTTLDEEFPAIDGATLLKIDTESTEPAVIEGGLHLIRRLRPVIFVEILSWTGTADAISALLPGNDYEHYLLTDAGPVHTSEVVGDAQWRNHLLVPRTGLSSTLVPTNLLSSTRRPE